MNQSGSPLAYARSQIDSEETADER